MVGSSLIYIMLLITIPWISRTYSRITTQFLILRNEHSLRDTISEICARCIRWRLRTHAAAARCMTTYPDKILNAGSIRNHRKLSALLQVCATGQFILQSDVPTYRQRSSAFWTMSLDCTVLLHLVSMALQGS